MARQGAGLQTSISERIFRVRIQNPTRTPDGEGDFTETWAPADPPDLFMSVRAASASDQERPHTPGTTVSMATHVLSGPYHPALTTQSRLLLEPASAMPQDPEPAPRALFHVVGVGSTEFRRVDCDVLVREVVV